MGTTLESLPRECLEEVLLYLDAKDVVSAMASSKTLRQVAGGERVWKEFAFRDFGVCEPPGEETPPSRTPYGDKLEGSRWRGLYADVRFQLHRRNYCEVDDPGDAIRYDSRCPKTEVAVLRSKGLFCDGGVDENDHENWFGNVFDVEGPTHRFYCSAASNNVHLVGCFAEGDVHGAYKWSAATRARRRFMAKTSSLLAHVLEKLSAQSSLPPEEQLNFDAVVAASTVLPPYDFNSWPSEELGAFFTHYVHQYRRDDPISQLFLFENEKRAPTPLSESDVHAQLNEIAEFVDCDHENEQTLLDPADSLTYTEPLPECEHVLYKYMRKTSPAQAGEARRAAMGKRPTARLAHTQWKEPLDLFAQSAATRHFTDDYARFDIRGLEIDDTVFGKVNAFVNAQTGEDPFAGEPVWRSARRPTFTDMALQLARTFNVADYERDGRRPRRNGDGAVEIVQDTSPFQPTETFSYQSFETHAGCTTFFVHDEETREELLYKKPCERSEPDDAEWIVGSCVDGDDDDDEKNKTKPSGKKRGRASRLDQGQEPRDGARNVNRDVTANSAYPLLKRNWKRWRHVGGVVSAFEIDRTGAFTCPVSCGAVFFSPGPPRLIDAATRRKLRAAAPNDAPPMSAHPNAAAVGDFIRNAVGGDGDVGSSVSLFDGVDTLEKLETLCDTDARGCRGLKIAKVTTFPNGVVVEFVPRVSRNVAPQRNGERRCDTYTADAFAPACWFKFHQRDALAPTVVADPQRDVLRYRLLKPRWARMHCVKVRVGRFPNPDPTHLPPQN